MVRRFINLVSFLLLTAYVGAQNIALADRVNEMFRIECMKELNLLTISNFRSNGQLPEKALLQDSRAISNKYGIYSYNGNVIEFSEDFSVQSPKNFSASCTLKTEDDINSTKTETYSLILEGILENQNPSGYCGGWRTFTLTLMAGKSLLLDHVPFAESCKSEREISSISLYPHLGYMTVQGSPGLPNILWFDKAPFKAETVYQK